MYYFHFQVVLDSDTEGQVFDELSVGSDEIHPHMWRNNATNHLYVTVDATVCTLVFNQLLYLHSSYFNIAALL